MNLNKLKVGTSVIARTEQEIIRDFQSLESQLSPENLHADGERSRSAAAKLHKQLMKKWAELEKELGRKPTDKELYSI